MCIYSFIRPSANSMCHWHSSHCTKNEVSIKDFFSNMTKSAVNVLKKLLMENFIFCAVSEDLKLIRWLRLGLKHFRFHNFKPSFQEDLSSICNCERRNFSLVARYLLQSHSLLVAEFTRYSLQKLLVAKIHSLLITEVACCKKPLVTRCKIRSLLVAEVARCKKSLVTRCKIRSLLVAEVAHCKKSLVTRCEIRLLLTAEVARCKNSLVTRCKIYSFLVAKNHSLLVAKFACYSLQQIT